MEITHVNCQSVVVWLEPPPPASTQVLIWNDGPRLIRPEPMKPIRELQRGDVVVLQGEERKVLSARPYR